jgi:8-oxo-dGTP pyrophosphatase MutT (NUDIX family)
MGDFEASGWRARFLEALAAYRPEGAGEEAVLARFQVFLEGPEPFLRTNPAGHVTASAIVTRLSGDSVLLVSHRKLGGWLQPGGHVEPDDPSVFAAAVREVREETGLDRLAAPLGDEILDIDVHPIPALGTDPAHVHYDVRFLLTSEDGDALVDGAAWFARKAIPGVDRDGSLERAVRKAVARLAAR